MKLSDFLIKVRSINNKITDYSKIAIDFMKYGLNGIIR